MSESFADDALIQEFVAEGREHLAAIEPDLLTLEQAGDQTEKAIINRIFRAIHSIKGASGFFGFDGLKRLSHVMESVLMQIRDGQLVPTPVIVDPLLVGVDLLNAMLDDVFASDSVDFAEVAHKLEAILRGESPTDLPPSGGGQPEASTAHDGEPSPDAAPAFNPYAPFTLSELQMASVKRQGQVLYTLEVHLDRDLAQKNRSPLDLFNLLESTGMMMDTVMDLNTVPDLDSCLDSPLQLQVAYATVLEPDLLSNAAQLPLSQIARLEPKSAEAQAEAAPAPVLVPDAPPAQAAVAESAPATPAAQPAAAASEPAHPTKAPPARAEGAGKAAEVESIRVRVDLLNRLMDLAGEMVLSRNQLLSLLARDTERNGSLAGVIQNIDLITSDLQEHIMQTRMQTVGSVFGKFPRLVRDVSRQLGKDIQLEMSGEDVELDKSILESLSDPLTHVIRNSCDHGLETPEDRLAQGKPAQGRIQLMAYHEGGQIHIAVKDDGRGIDGDKIAQKALSMGLITENDFKRFSPQERVNLIFLPGLSTAKAVSDLSGRGVGMDVVKTNIEKLGGSITIETQMGKGTTLLMRLPLTLAIIPSLVVGVQNQRFAMPQINLVELVRVNGAERVGRVEQIGQNVVLKLRGRLLPLLSLTDVLGLNPAPSAEGKAEPPSLLHGDEPLNILVLKVATHHFGLVVDELFDTEEIVVKPLSTLIKGCRSFAGATIMGDGRVAMILDVGGILELSKLSFDEVHAEERRRQQANQADQQASQNRSQVILFRHGNAQEETFALPLASVQRLEKFQPDDLEWVAGRELLNYRGHGLPILRLSDYLPVRPMPDGLSEAFLIIPKEGTVGIIASAILDTLDVEMELDAGLVDGPGVLGTRVVNDRLTLFLDPVPLLSQAGLLHHDFTQSAEGTTHEQAQLCHV